MFRDRPCCFEFYCSCSHTYLVAHCFTDQVESLATFAFLLMVLIGRYTLRLKSGSVRAFSTPIIICVNFCWIWLALDCSKRIGAILLAFLCFSCVFIGCSGRLCFFLYVRSLLKRVVHGSNAAALLLEIMRHQGIKVVKTPSLRQCLAIAWVATFDSICRAVV